MQNYSYYETNENKKHKQKKIRNYILVIDNVVFLTMELNFKKSEINCVILRLVHFYTDFK